MFYVFKYSLFEEKNKYEAATCAQQQRIKKITLYNENRCSLKLSIIGFVVDLEKNNELHKQML